MYPLGVNGVMLSSKFPVIFEVSTDLYFKSVIDKLVSENKLTNIINGLPDGVSTNTYRKILNDIPRKKIPDSVIFNPVDTYEWRIFTADEQRSRIDYKITNYYGNTVIPIEDRPNTETYHVKVPVIDIPDKLGKYWVKSENTFLSNNKFYNPDYDLIQKDGYKQLEYSTGLEIDNFSLDGQITARPFHRRFTIVKKLDPLVLPIQIKFKVENHHYTKPAVRGVEPQIKYKSSWYEVVNGTNPFMFNLGLYRSVRDYHGLFELFTPDYNDKDFTNFTQENSDGTINGFNVDIREASNYYFSDRYNKNTPINSLFPQTDKHIYEFIYPREYGLKGIKFKDVLLDYKIDSFTKPSGKGEVTYDRFRVKLPRPMDANIEIVKERSSWEYNKRKIVLLSKAGWINSGSDIWGNSPVATGYDVAGELPPNIEVTSGGTLLSPNTGNDKYLGYYFSIKTDKMDKLGIRVTRNPMQTLLREELDDSKFKIKITMESDDEHFIHHVFIQDYHPASVARASTHRDERNRWSIYVNSIDIEIEFYMK